MEAFGAAIFNVFAPLIAVMGLETALMEVMRLDAVSWNYSLIIECIGNHFLVNFSAVHKYD